MCLLALKGRAEAADGKAKDKVPKAVAGVPVPKRLRKASIITSVLNHPLGRRILADALVAAAGAAATALNRHQASGTHASQDGDGHALKSHPSSLITSDLAKSAAGALGHLALDVVEQVLPKKEAKKVKAKAKKENKDRKSTDGTKDGELPARHH